MEKVQYADGKVIFTASTKGEGAFAPIAFQYRPLRGAALARFQNDSVGAPGNFLIAGEKILAQQLVSWDAKDSDGREVPCTASGLRELAGMVLGEITALVVENTNEAEEEVKNS